MFDLIIRNARIYTQWIERPWAEAAAVQSGRIVAIGNDETILPMADNRTLVINLHRALVLPGFSDAHIHLYDLARRKAQLPLDESSSMDDLLQRIRSRASSLPPGAWLLGYGWNESSWPEPRFPTRHDLDGVTAGRPTVIWRTDLHAAVANSAALKAAGIGPETQPPPSGIIDKDERGTPTGVLRESAINLVQKAIPPMDEREAAANLQSVVEELHKLGIVSVHDQRIEGRGIGGATALRLYSRLNRLGGLRLRISCNFEKGEVTKLIETGVQSGFGDEWVRVGHIKLFADGSLGSHTAWMIEPYEDTPEDRGIPLTEPEELDSIIRRAHRHGLAISIHAIGDKAIRTVLDIFQRVLKETTAAPPQIPHRIEHVITIQPDDLHRLASLGLVASVQPIHCPDDMIKVDRLWGRRGVNTYRFRSMKDAGIVLASGSDAPVANPNPLWGIHAAVTRQNLEGRPKGGWYPSERLTVAEAVESYTLGPAIAIGQEHQQGRLAPGYLADMVVLDRDIFSIPPQEIAKTRVTMTIVGGEIVHRTE